MRRTAVDGPIRSPWLLPLVGTAQFLVVLDMTIVNMALPALRADLGMSPTSLHWVMTGYAVAFGGFLLAGGRLGDLVGRRNVFVAGLAVFTAASLACGLAPSGSSLVAARVLQGLGAAVLSPGAFAILLAGFPSGSERNRAIAKWGSIGAFGAVAGIVAGGALTELVGWRWVFLVNVPVGLAALAVTRGVVPATRSPRRAVDVAAGLLVTAGIGALVFVLSNGPGEGWTSRSTLVGGAAGLATLVAFGLRERRSPAPLLPTWILAERQFLVAGTVGFLHGAVMLGMLLLLTIYLQGARGLTWLQTAASLLVLRAPAIGWAGLVARLVTRFGAQPLLILGSVLMTAGLVVLTRVPVEGELAVTLVPALLVLGVGIPCVFVSLSAAALGDVQLEHAGVASGLFKALQWVGGALGLAIVAAVSGGLETGSADSGPLVEGVRAGFVACSVLSALSIAVACLGLVRTRRLLATAC